MSTRLCNVVVDAADPRALAEFWANLLDWRVSHADAEEVDVVAPPDEGCEFDLVFVPVADRKAGKNRVHLDLSSASPDHQASIVAHAESLGAVRADIGQGNVPWIVLADPEGNEFCVLEHRPEYASTGAVAAVVVDALDPLRVATFWTATTGWPLVTTTPASASLRSPGGRGPWLEFVRDDEPHRVKNRVHLDVAPLVGDDQWTEVTRLVELGARKVDVGQGSVPWQVMADVEGNEFCVLTPR
jgi:predicted enzyme related to lactoylglutathione lyase